MDKSDLKKCSKAKLRNMLIFYKAKNVVVKSILETGIIIDKCLPYIFSLLLVFYIKEMTNKPYVIEDRLPYSNGFEFDESLQDKRFIYSTGWNNNSRTEMTFRLNGDIDLNEAAKIAEMDLSDIKKLFTLESVETFYKEDSVRDSIYTADMVIIPGEDELVRSKMRKEITSEMFISLITAFLGGTIIHKSIRLVFDNSVEKNLESRIEEFEAESSKDIRLIKATYEQEKRKFKEKKHGESKKLRFYKKGV